MDQLVGLGRGWVRAIYVIRPGGGWLGGGRNIELTRRCQTLGVVL